MAIETTASAPAGRSIDAVSVNIDAAGRARRALDAAERRLLPERARNGVGDG